MTAEQKMILNLQKKVSALETKLKANNFTHLKKKAEKYDALLKKYQNVLVECKHYDNMMRDMRIAVQNLLKK